MLQDFLLLIMVPILIQEKVAVKDKSYWYMLVVKKVKGAFTVDWLSTRNV